MRWRPPLRAVLLAVSLLILALPLGGIAALHLYENELIRGTEAQLLVQGAIVREVFRSEFLGEMAARGAHDPLSGSGSTDPGRPIIWERPPRSLSDLPFEPLLPTLDISKQRLRPPDTEAAPAPVPAEPVALMAGARIAPALRASALATLAGIRIVDQNGIVVATTRAELGLSLAHREEVERALRGEDVSLLRERTPEGNPPLESISRGQRYRVFVALPVIEKNRVIGAVILSRTPLDIAKALYFAWPTLLVGALTLLGVVVVVAFLTSFTINRPLSALTRQAEGVARGERDAVIEPARTGIREVVQLSAALARMARSLEERGQYIRTFASHVSHEFKTPLTTIRGIVELLQDHMETMSADERRRFLESLSEASSRLERLVRRLLELARADVVRPGTGTTNVPEALNGLAGRYREAGLDVMVRHSEGVGSIRMAQDSFEEIICNLLDNARQHGGRGIAVQMATRGDDSIRPRVIEIRISDTGSGIADANVSRVFTPFFTTAREAGGSGLGLSIVRSILGAHGGSIDLERAGPGASFLVRIPADGGTA